MRACLTLLFCGILFSLFAQQDSLGNNPNLFALSAEDIDHNQNLVESILNRKTTTASQVEQFASDAPATIYIVSKTQIRDRGYENLLDILDDIPEVEIQRYGSPEFNQHITLRGVAGNEKFLILQDGIRISAPTGDTHSVGYNFSIEHAEQVEVIIGPASALYGVDAFAGIIQIVTQNGSGEKPVNSFKTSLGQFGTSHHALQLGKRFRDFRIGFTGTYYHSNEPDFTQYYPQEFGWYTDHYQPDGTLLVSPFVQQAQTVGFEGENREFAMPTTSWYANVNAQFKDLEINYNRHYDSYSSCGSTRPEFCVISDEARFAYFIETIYGRHRFRSNNLKWTLESIFSFHTYQLDRKTAFINTYTSYEPGYKMEFGKSKKIREQLRYNFSEKVNLVAGLSYEVLDDLPLTGDLPQPFDFDQPADLQNQYYLGSNFTDVNGNDLRIQQGFFYLHYQNYGSYLQFQGLLTPSTHLTLGLRYDLNTRYGESFNPRMGIVWKPLQGLSFKMLYGEALLSPSPRKSNSHFGSFFPERDNDGNITGLGSNFFHLSNPDLEPEKLRSIETSMRYVASNNLVFSLNAYYTRINNLINKFAQDPELTSFKGIEVGFIETGQNEGQSNIYGITGRIDAVYNTAAGLGLNAFLAYSYSDGNANDEPLLFNAKHNVKGGLEIKHRWFSISPRVYYRSSSYGSLRNEEGNLIGTDPFAVVNLFARVNLFANEKWDLSAFAKIDNLLDRRYHNAFIGGAEGFARVPQRPRTIRIGVNLILP